MRIATFNVQNMRLRGARLDGARDTDIPEDQGPKARELDPKDRALTAQVIRDTHADLIALQEVFDQPTLDHFHEHFLAPIGAPYPFRHCLPGNDGRGLDVAVMSRLPLDEITSHAHLTPALLGMDLPHPNRPIFRRDVLRVRVGPLTLYICHLKAPYPETARTWSIRQAEVAALHTLITRAHGPKDLWLILGDLNEPIRSPTRPGAIAPLEQIATDLMHRLPAGTNWSWHNAHSHQYGHPDALLASPELARSFPETMPEIIRSGMSLQTHKNTRPHLPQVGHHRPHASDHAAVVVEFQGLTPASF